MFTPAVPIVPVEEASKPKSIPAALIALAKSDAELSV